MDARREREESSISPAGKRPAPANQDADEGFSEKIALLADSLDDLVRLGKKDFLQGVFEATFSLIPEAEKGSLYELVGGRFIPVHARRYDFELLSRLSFGPDEVFLDFEVGSGTGIDAFESRVEGRDEKAFPPEIIQTFKALGTYSGFISLHAPIQVEGRIIGLICLENFSGQGFSRLSKKILKFYARVISDFYGQLVREEKELRRFSEKFDSLTLLAAGVAHELNSPLAVIKSTASVVGEKVDAVLPRLGQLRTRLRPRDYELLESLVLDQSAPDLAAPRSRARIRELEAIFAAADEPDAKALAELFTRRGWDERAEEFNRALGGPEGRAAAELLLDLDDLRNLLAVTREATDKAAAIVKSLWTWTQLRGEADALPLDIAAELEAALATLRPELGAIEVERLLAPGFSVLGDRERLGEVWVNLLRNAIQAMGDRGRIEVSLRHSEDGEGGPLVVARIADEGTGIAPEIRNRVYDPFFTTKAPGRGSGLGLPLAKAIVEAHGGSISFESSPEGTTFTVALPAVPTHS